MKLLINNIEIFKEDFMMILVAQRKHKAADLLGENVGGVKYYGHNQQTVLSRQ